MSDLHVSSSSSEYEDSSSEVVYSVDDENAMSQISFDNMKGVDDDDDVSYSDEMVSSDYSEDDVSRFSLAFLDELDLGLPDIDDMSEEAPDIIGKYFSKLRPKKDEGVFVDPLTGEPLQGTPLSSSDNYEEEMKGEAEEMEECEEEAESEEVKGFETELSSDSDIVLSDKEDRVTIVAVEENQKAFDAFLQWEAMNTTKVLDRESFDKDAYDRYVEAEREACTNLIQKIIDSIIRPPEQISPLDQIRRSADRRKVLQYIHKMYKIYRSEKYKLNVLIQKCAEYFERKGTFRALTPDNRKTLESDKQKFIANLTYLDSRLQKERGTSRKIAVQLDSLNAEVEKLQDIRDTKIVMLEEFLRSSLQVERRPNTLKILDDIFRSMSSLRNSVSSTRLRLMIAQHDKDTIVKALSNFDTYAHVNIKDLETMNLTLQADLKKLQHRSRVNIHTMAHYMERQKMLANTVETQSLALEELMEDRLLLRKQIFASKKKRSQLHDEILSSNYLNTLVDKTTLMLDYDRSTNISNKNNEKLDKLRRQRKFSEHILFKLLSKCDVDFMSDIRSTWGEIAISMQAYTSPTFLSSPTNSSDVPLPKHRSRKDGVTIKIKQFMKL